MIMMMMMMMMIVIIIAMIIINNENMRGWRGLQASNNSDNDNE